MDFFTSGRNTISKIVERVQDATTNQYIKPEGHDVVRHSNVGEDFCVTYTEFEVLPAYAAGTDLMFIFNSIKQHFDSHEWLDSFRAIDNLRILNKYHGEEINLIFQAFGNYIIDCILSRKTAVVKNILAFFDEVLRTGVCNRLDMRVVTKLIPLLLAKCKSPQKSIKRMAATCLESLVTQFTCETTLVEFCTNTVRKNKSVDKEGFYFLTKSISIMKAGLSAVQGETLRYIFITMRLATTSDNGENKALAKRIIRFLHELMGSENYAAYLHYLVLNNVMGKTDAEELMEVVTDRPRHRASNAQSIRDRRSQTSAGLKPQFELV